MTYAGLQLFMNNLKELIYCKDNPPIINNPSIMYEMPQFQQLYEELCRVIRIFLIDQDEDEKVRNLKKRFKQAAEEAQANVPCNLVSLEVFPILNLQSGIKKLTCPLYTYDENDFKSPAYLESLKLIGSGSRKNSMEVGFPKGEPIFEKNHFTMPATIKKLTLLWCRLPWSDILIIQSLLNLEELNVLDNAFEESQ
ncbi:unnamed protein product [Lactuca saligna]|uniref:Uncharacterized protein n=1 Tax=Lactuca saligna TaxID=75948 RepID=A0AA35YNR7_LACSI|nr:unnamed protein product [Lactuca saligna]